MRAEIAAANGIPLAQCRLADIYEVGDNGVPPNMLRARYWLNEAARRDFALAQTRLAVKLEDEGNGRAAIYWYARAASGGDPMRYTSFFGSIAMGNTA
jgi:TPR repeat protein